MPLCIWVPATGAGTHSKKPPILDTRTRRGLLRRVPRYLWEVPTIVCCKNNIHNLHFTNQSYRYLLLTNYIISSFISSQISPSPLCLSWFFLFIFHICKIPLLITPSFSQNATTIPWVTNVALSLCLWSEM